MACTMLFFGSTMAQRTVFVGTAILADKPFKLADRIRIEKWEGTVKDVGIRTTRIQTAQGSLVGIPNAMIAKTPVETLLKGP